MGKIIGFGDFLLRLSPPGYLRFIQADQFDVNYTGAEANVLVSLSIMGLETQFVTRLPNNDIAEAGIAMLRKFGVGVQHIARGGDRMGLFYVEKGAAQRPGKVVYDRKETAIAQASVDDFDWNAVFSGTSRLHMTGITPALGPGMPALCINIVRMAKEHGIAVSCDLNYRKNMWSETEAKACMERVIPGIDLLIANEEDADKVLGIRAAGTEPRRLC